MRWMPACLMVACAARSPQVSAPAAVVPVDAPGELALLDRDDNADPSAFVVLEPSYGTVSLSAGGPRIETSSLGHEWLAADRLTIVERRGELVRLLVPSAQLRLLVWVPRRDTRPWAHRIRSYDSFDEPIVPVGPDVRRLDVDVDVEVPARVCLYAAPGGALVGVTRKPVTLRGTSDEPAGWERLEIETAWGPVPLHAYEPGGAWHRCPAAARAGAQR